MRREPLSVPAARFCAHACLPLLLLAAGLAACSGSGGSATVAHPPAPTGTPAPTATPTPVPTATPKPSPTASPTPTPKPSPTASPTPTPKPTASPTPTPSPSGSPTPAAILTMGCQVGSNYIDFENGTDGGYEPAPGSGTLTVVKPAGVLAGIGLTPGQGGTIQSLDEGTGPVTLPGPFITFTGSPYQLQATDIPPGQTVGPFTIVAGPGNTSIATFDVQGVIDNGDTPVNSFDLTFTATFPVPPAQLFTDLPLDTTCNVTSATALTADAHARRPGMKRR